MHNNSSNLSLLFQAYSILQMVRALFKHLNYPQNYQHSTAKRTELRDLQSLTQGYGAGFLYLCSLIPVTPAPEPHSTPKRTQGILNLLFHSQKDWFPSLGATPVLLLDQEEQENLNRGSASEK